MRNLIIKNISGAEPNGISNHLQNGALKKALDIITDNIVKKPREVPLSEEEQKLTDCLTEISKLLIELNYTDQQQEHILKVSALMLINNHANIIKDMLLNDIKNGLLFLRRALEKIQIPADYTKTSELYRTMITEIFQKENFHGRLFKSVEYGTPDFSIEEFKNNEAVLLFYDRVLSGFDNETKVKLKLKSIDSPKNAQKVIEILNKHILNNEEIYDVLVNAETKPPILSAKLKNMREEIETQTQLQKDIFRNKIKHCNRLLLETLFKDTCPVNNKIIYKETMEEFKQYRLKASEYKDIFEMKYGDLQAINDNNSHQTWLFQEFLEDHANRLKSMMVDIYTGNRYLLQESVLHKIQNSYFFTAQNPLNNRIKEILEPIIEYKSYQNGGSAIRLKSEVSDNVFSGIIINGLNKNALLNNQPRFLHFLYDAYIDKKVEIGKPTKAYHKLSSVREKSLISIIEKVERRHEITEQKKKEEILKAITEPRTPDLFKYYYNKLGKHITILLGEKGKTDPIMLKINATEKKNTSLNDIKDLLGLCITVGSYKDIETVMDYIEGKFADFILEKENLFAENSDKKAYRDVKYILKINSDLCFELQIKTLYEKVIVELLDHDTIYKNKYRLSPEEIGNLKPIVYGLLWERHLQLAKDYQDFYNFFNTNQ